MILVAMEKEKKGEAAAPWASPAWPQTDGPEQVDAEAALPPEAEAFAEEPDPHVSPERPPPKASGTMPKVVVPPVPLPRTKTG